MEDQALKDNILEVVAPIVQASVDPNLGECLSEGTNSRPEEQTTVEATDYIPEKQLSAQGIDNDASPYPDSKKRTFEVGEKKVDEEGVKKMKTSNGGLKGSPACEVDRPNGHGSVGEDKELKSTSEVVSKYLILDPLPSETEAIPPLNKNERKELEAYLEIDKSNPWRDDWIGNLAFADEEISNPDGGKSGKERTQKKSLLQWASLTRGKLSLRILHNLLRFVYHLKETPKQAKDILASVHPNSALEIRDAVRRVSYDPIVLRQDGWTTQKSSEPVGASGGPYRIGETVFWQGLEGIVIAYIHDHDLGDLWKAMWLEEFDTFDLEAEELEDATKKYERRQKQKQAAASSSENALPKNPSLSSIPSKSVNSTDLGKRSARNSASSDLYIKGIEQGIVLAISYSRGSRPGVFWPARVMHASETFSSGSQNKRGIQKQKIDVVFLAPYWNAPAVVAGGRSYATSLQRHGTSIFSSGALFEMESVDASEEIIQEYAYDSSKGLDLEQLRTSFKFTGLPKAAFPRFVDSHRLAVGLKIFAKSRIKTAANELDRATASLFEAHPLSVQTALFPPAVLHLPFGDILSNMPPPYKEGMIEFFNNTEPNFEPPLKLDVIIDSMKPPLCWGQANVLENVSPKEKIFAKTFKSPLIPTKLLEKASLSPLSLDDFAEDLPDLKQLLAIDSEVSISAILRSMVNRMTERLPRDKKSIENADVKSLREKAGVLMKEWALLKTQGEELIASAREELEFQHVLSEWHRFSERIYKYITLALSSQGFGNGMSAVITDSLCNQHITSAGNFERAVRLPAAIKAAKMASAESNKINIISGVGDQYIIFAEKKVVVKAHSKSYLRRIKKKCLSISQDRGIVPLTENSEGQGGEDTHGTKGTWMAALAGVGAAIKAVDMIVGGECVNAFCATRPPGHHAGRELHPMKAVSNGFCVLNAAASAAHYATSSRAENGPGLKRVCVIDIDVHHGNGTQDILCSTYDPRFLYVSIHAGGADVNGSDLGGDTDQFAHHLGRKGKKGIFPGRCGDTSPHEGVLNIPLGAKVTSQAVGTALITKVNPAVEAFSPDLIIISAGFDAHKNDPLGLGGLTAEDYGTLTEVVCQLAHKCCSGRVLSILEGGYGVPCCRPQENLTDHPDFLQASTEGEQKLTVEKSGVEECSEHPPTLKADVPIKPLELLDLGEDIPDDMKDVLPYPLMKRLDKCHQEGFIDCVREHVRSLAKSNTRS